MYDIRTDRDHDNDHFDICCLVIFTGVMIGKRSKKSAEGFYLGGRGMGPLVTAMSAEASDMSSYLLMGIPGLAYLSGVADASWTAIGLAIGTYLNFLLVARRLRRYSVQLDAITIPSFISKRYGEKKPIIMGIAVSCHPGVLRALCGLRSGGHRQAVQQSVRLELHALRDRGRHRHHQLYLCGRLQRRRHHGPDPVCLL